MKKIMVVSALSLAIISGCKSIPVEVHRGELDTNYSYGQAEKSKNLSIAIVDGTGRFGGIPESQANLAHNKSTLNRYDVQNKYLSELKKSFRSSFEAIITNRGFTYTGPYSSFDEITYRDKKSSYLAVVPIYEVTVTEEIKTHNRFSAYIEETGNLKVDGFIQIKFVEPLTKQVISQKRIDLSKLNINEPYVVQAEKNLGNDLIANAIENAMKETSAPDSLVVTYDRAYAKAMTDFYQGTMKELDKYISSEELLDYRQDVQELKGSKVF